MAEHAGQILEIESLRRVRRWLGWMLVASFLAVLQWYTLPVEFRNRPPAIRDCVEVENIAWNLAHGAGYRFDWDSPQWRESYQSQNSNASYDHILARRGSYTTLSRPPLMPLLVAGCRAVFGEKQIFCCWRLVDLCLCAAAGTLLCAAAFRRGGWVAAAIVLVVFWYDPVRWMYIPGWWTEGLAFDLICVICWLMVPGVAPRSAVSRGLTGGITIGLLCLDRSVFILAMPFLCAVLAIGIKEPGHRLRNWIKHAVAILCIAMAVQSPWWIRNIAASRQFLPLGTQGGFNLPDEYGDAALQNHGIWRGDGMRDAWLPRPAAAQQLPIPAGFTDQSLEKLWPGDRRRQLLIVAFCCTSTASEVKVCRAGTRAAVDWFIGHLSSLPRLMWDKTIALIEIDPPMLAVAAIVIGLGASRCPGDRRLLVLLMGVISSYVLAVALTHMESVRF